jgi:methyl-accepting chemotaxis protein
MIRLIRQRIGVRIAILVNTCLAVVIAAGSVYLITQQRQNLEEQFLAKAKMESVVGAKSIGRLLEEAIDNGVFSVNDALDKNYVEIPGFDPPKYHTKYDAYLDKAILSLQDEFLKDKSIIFAVAVDINGYLPTHNTPFQHNPTGDKQKDLSGNRTKRVFNDPIGIKAAKNETEGFLQVYRRDTGETLWDVSSPIYVKGKHWGGFRIGMSPKVLENAQREHTVSLIIIMLVILLVSTWMIFFLINKTLEPLRRFSRIAADLADGNVDEKIEAKTEDEIGQLADVLERLRMSIRSAMERLMRKQGI